MQQDLGAEIHPIEVDPQVQAALLRTYFRRPHPLIDQPGPSTSARAAPPRRSACFTSHTHIVGRARVDSDSDERLFFFFYSFWYLMPKGEKIRGVNRFSTP